MEPLRGAISARARFLGKLLQRRSLWHAVLFYIVGEVVGLRLPDYTPYAWQHGLWQQGWPGHLSALEMTWKPYLEGTTEFETAVNALVDSLVVDSVP